MRIRIDLANSPHVPLFNALQKELVALGHEVEITARDFAETVALANAAELSAEVIGRHGGAGLYAKGANLTKRAWDLRQWARARHFDLAISHNSYSQIVASRALRLKTVTMMDYEHQPANHLAFRLSHTIIVPACFPAQELRRYGASIVKVRRYHGIKEDVYLSDYYQPRPDFTANLRRLDITSEDLLVVMRPPARTALYHRFENALFDDALTHVLNAGAKVILLPRDSYQRDLYTYCAGKNLIIPETPLPGPDLIASSDLVISAGGTINREAAALGIPAASVFLGKWPAVDQMLVEEGRLMRVSSREDLNSLALTKKTDTVNCRDSNTRDEVVKLILK